MVVTVIASRMDTNELLLNYFYLCKIKFLNWIISFDFILKNTITFTAYIYIFIILIHCLKLYYTYILEFI